MQVIEKLVQIQEYEPSYQKGIEALIIPIQTVEFLVPITKEDQPDLMSVTSTFQAGLGNFWVATCNGEVVGTIGIVDIGDKQVALKKMFVRADFRGKDKNVSAQLMDRAKKWCKSGGVKTIILGTVQAMKAAHRFYEKNEFKEIAKGDLPENFPLVAVDDKFYRLDF